MRLCYRLIPKDMLFKYKINNKNLDVTNIDDLIRILKGYKIIYYRHNLLT